MTTNSLTGRTHYQSSRAISIPSFVAWTILAFTVAVVLAAFMFWLYVIGHYYIILVPILCALAVAGMARLAVVKGHCRNWIVGSLTGIFLGLVLYIGSYYIGMIYHLGAEVATDPDALIHYIRVRLATDVVRDTHTPKEDDDRSNRRSSSPGMNWFRFGMEFIAVTGIVTAAAYRRSRKTYCEQCHRWLTRETTPFEPDKAATILDSLQSGSARALAAVCATPPYTTIPNATLAVEFCPSLKDGMTRDCPVFVSLKNITAGPKGATLDAFEQSKGKVLERYVQLSPDEVPALAPRFPVFEAYAGRAAVASLLPQVPPEEYRDSAERAGERAEITPLGTEHHGRVLTRKMMWLGAAIGIAGLLSFIGGLALLAWGATILEGVDKGTTTAKGAGITLSVVGGVSVLAALAGMLFDSSFGANRILRKAFKAEVARRTGVLVEPDNPEALFIEIVPKLNWGKMMLDNASDIGLLLVDKARREVRFEGDKERWRLPAASITSSDIEQYVHGQGAGATKVYYVVLRATRRDGFWEAPVRERRGMGVLSGKRKKLAARLAATIQEIRGR